MNMHEHKAFEAQVESSEALRCVAIIPPSWLAAWLVYGPSFSNGFYPDAHISPGNGAGETERQIVQYSGPSA